MSAREGFGRADVLDLVSEKVWPTGEERIDPVMKLAVVGRRNVGKSTFVNSLANEERVIAILEDFGKEKLEFMINDLNHPDKIEKTHKIVLPFFLHRAIQGVRERKLQTA